MSKLNQAFLRAYNRDLPARTGGPHLPLPESKPSAQSVHATFQHLEARVAPHVPEPEPPPIDELSRFSPAWEVDELPWPAICDQMRDATGQDLFGAIERWRQSSEACAQVVGVTSLIRREGRSTVAASLARAAAGAGRRVALLDADLESPRLSLALELGIDTAWTDCAQHHKSLSEAAVRTVADDLVLFPLTTESRMSPLSWNSPGTLELFRQLRSHFDLIVVDLGPLTDVLKRGLQGGDDSPLDGTVLLRDVRITGADQVLLIARELHHAGLNIVGVVDNFNESDASWSS